MTRRLLPTAALVALTAGLAGCGGGDGDQGARAAGGSASAASGYTAAQLEQALLADAAGFRRAGEPDSGEYGTLKAVQSFAHLQREVKIDKSRCAGANPAGSPPGDAPAALVSFSGGAGGSATETLMAMPDADAAAQVRTRVPAGCARFRTLVGGQWAQHEVVERPGGAIGSGSRTVGVVTTSGGAHTKTWYVVARAPRLLATVSLYGPNATREDAERLARAALDQAARILG
ncbi:hypothetical protein [Actinomadura parmotrematis]|uniref:Sensor domain-containing protein n=1 Tax=Actinomadura parmotrematis TaxID=2864039 RepID=A0ABS7FNI5_9ACTN|nr:hypothetical protein [Actinomadura parmotrematis]MBW8481948.1 hypothetical protein [Actinomadura parmotrematis]